MANKSGDKSKKSPTSSNSKVPTSVADKDKNSLSSVQESPANEIITAFGGLRPLANKLGIAVSTVQGWKERDSIPAARHEEILQAAAKSKITLDVTRVRESDNLQNEPTEQDQTTSLKPDSKSDSKPVMQSSDASTGKSSFSKSPIPEIKSSVPSSGSKSSADKSFGDSGHGPKTDKKESDLTSGIDPQLVVVRKGGGLNSFLYGMGFCALAVAGIVFFRGHWLPLVENIPSLGGDISKTSVVDLEDRIVGLEQYAFSNQNQTVDPNRFLALSEDVRILKLDQSELDRQLSDLTSGGVVVKTGDIDQGLMDSLRGDMRKTQDRLQELEIALATDGSSGVGAIPSTTPSTGTSSSDSVSLQQLSALKSQLSSLITEVSDLKTRKVASPGKTKVPATEDVYLALGVLQLRDALRGSGPFIKELDLVRAVASTNSTVQDLISPLSSFAASGLPSLTELRAGFPAAARNALSADKIAGGQSWVDKALGRVSDVISIRPIEVLDGVGTSSVLARAENYMVEGDLSGALRELESLTSAASRGMENWLVLAKQRQEGERVSGKLALLLIGVTEQGSGVGGVQ
ncbi:COG4223 family protein [Kiloniella antarctica]|uniref:COG4223 family protein n=1 Tax=Kiloniella antarctica TaxID=1550907 RepID=A0ABW5BHW4_9PROT